MLKTILNTFPRETLIKVSLWLRPVMVLWFKGNRFTDPIDGQSYRKFLPYGYQVKRKNALSPGTLSLERHRLMWLYLKNETPFFIEKLKVLHMAPEQSFYGIFKKMSNLEYVTADLSSPLADVKTDITSLPFPDNTFDVVLCNHVLEHIPDDHKAISELYRVMKRGGWGIFQIPQDLNLTTTYEDFSIINPDERAKHFGQYDHVRVYGLDYADRLRNIGFEVEMLDYGKKIGVENIVKFSLTEGELLPVVRKII